MASLRKTLAALAAARSFEAPRVPAAAAARLRPLGDFGANPGALAAYSYLPATLKPGAALVVVLHGCTQSAAAYDHGAGWSQLADEAGFALLLPEQSPANNPNRCFNWFATADVTRGAGEAASIRAMVGHMVDAHRLDPRRVFVSGLSAGGAMAASLLAIYPDVFAAGAVIAGLPHGAAGSVAEAMEAMRGRSGKDAPALREALASASPHRGPWPRLILWHGDRDRVVVPANAAAIREQWRDAHGLASEPDAEEAVDGALRRVWREPGGAVVVEAWSVPGMGHGTPVAPARDGLGHAMPHILDAGVSSTRHSARFFGLTDGATVRPRPAAAAAEPPRQRRPAGADEAPGAEVTGTASHAPGGVGAIMEVVERALHDRQGPGAAISRVIEDALRKAGLR